MKPPHQCIVIVVGAGASQPYGFPLGRQLMKVAASQNPFLDTHVDFGPEDLEEDLRFTEAELSAFQSDLARSRRATIDAFLADRPDYAHIGRVVISMIIAQCEDRDRLAGMDI